MSQTQFLANSDILDGWEWVAAKGLQTCLPCLFMDGLRFPLETSFSDVKRCVNKSCRCQPIAVISGWPRPRRTLGPEWFKTLTPDQQQMMMKDDD